MICFAIFFGFSVRAFCDRCKASLSAIQIDLNPFGNQKVNEQTEEREATKEITAWIQLYLILSANIISALFGIIAEHSDRCSVDWVDNIVVSLIIVQNSVKIFGYCLWKYHNFKLSRSVRRIGVYYFWIGNVSIFPFLP